MRRTGRRERKLTFGRKGAMTGQEGRKAGLTSGIVSGKGRRKRKLTFGWKGDMTGQEERKAVLQVLEE